jgi:BRCA1-associated protein
VVFIKSIKFRSQPSPENSDLFPYLSNSPLTPAGTESSHVQPSTTLKSKPVAPPTPALKELPTCPVCLERMDESTGLLTILCQHVFHCTCLEKWRGSGCPVCRYTQEDLSLRRGARPEVPQGLNECAICHSDANLWVCLICGHVGCGRYDAAHAFLHYKQTSHCFSMDLMTQRVWDYDSDGYVHRIMQNKTDGKLLELPAAAANYDHNARPSDEEDSVPREKLETLGMDYTHLLTSQLESQRLYFEEKLERAADKASEATAAAIAAADGAERAVAALSGLQAKHDTLTTETLPEVEKERNRLARKSEKFEAMARRMEQSWRDEKAVAESLMEKVTFLDEKVEKLSQENQELKETNRDMGFFISGQEKLKEMELGEDVTEGTVSVPEEKRKGKGKGRKR